MSLYVTPILPDELYHFGIKGQKWGRRRFQNEDMTWTAAGKERYGSASDGSHKVSSEEKRKTAVKDDGSSSAKSKKTRTPEEEAKAAKRKEIAKKALIAAGTAAAVAGIAYFGSKKLTQLKADAAINAIKRERIKKLSEEYERSFTEHLDKMYNDDAFDSDYDKSTRKEMLNAFNKRINKAHESASEAKKLARQSSEYAKSVAKKGKDKEKIASYWADRSRDEYNNIRNKGLISDNKVNQINEQTRRIQEELRRRQSEVSNAPKAVVRRSIPTPPKSNPQAVSNPVQRTSNSIAAKAKSTTKSVNKAKNTFTDLDNLNDHLLKKNQRLLRNP